MDLDLVSHSGHPIKKLAKGGYEYRGTLLKVYRAGRKWIVMEDGSSKEYEGKTLDFALLHAAETIDDDKPAA